MSKLLSFTEAQIAGEAMHARWAAQSDEPPPLVRSDSAWADLARVAWDSVHGQRAAQCGRNPKGGDAKQGSVEDEHAVPKGCAQGTQS